MLIRHFLHSEIYPDVLLDVDAPLDEFPYISGRTKLGMYLSASATFYAPSELCGPGGMHREIIRCNPSWYKKVSRFDTVLVRIDPELEGMRGLRVARVRSFFAFDHEDFSYSCALVEWFAFDDVVPDPVTAMWIVRPDTLDDAPVTSVISVSSIVRACHLMPIFGQTFLPLDFSFTDSLDAFNAYYVNSYADYHSHETVL